MELMENGNDTNGNVERTQSPTNNTNIVNNDPRSTLLHESQNRQSVIELYTAQKKKQKKESRAEKDRKQAMIQALLYILVFLVSYIFSAVYNALDQQGNPPHWSVLLLSQIFYPMQGFMVFLIYLRPSMVSIRRRNPSYTTRQTFVAAIKSRGEHERNMKRRRTFKKISKRSDIQRRSSTARRGSVNQSGNGEDRWQTPPPMARKRTSETDLSMNERSSQRVRLTPDVMDELRRLDKEEDKKESDAVDMATVGNGTGTDANMEMTCEEQPRERERSVRMRLSSELDEDDEDRSRSIRPRLSSELD